jgi:putative transcriptional regulator
MGKDPTMSLRGRLLIAEPMLLDPNFVRTVVFLVEHTDEAAAGVVLNRPSETPLAEALPPWAPRAADPPLVFVGGPVAPTAAVGLARTKPGVESLHCTPVLDGVALLDLESEPDDLDEGVISVRLFAGYAGWGGGQLEQELEYGGWIVVDAEADDAFTDEPATLWRRVLRRQRGRIALTASYPPDPSLQ